MTDSKELIKVESQDKSWEEALKTENWISPEVNIYETDNHYFLQANMPGVNRSNIKITLESDHLVLMGRVQFANLSDKNYILKEAVNGNYYRKFRITDGIDAANIEAKYEDGQLTLSLAKSDKMKTKIIEID